MDQNCDLIDQNFDIMDQNCEIMDQKNDIMDQNCDIMDKKFTLIRIEIISLAKNISKFVNSINSGWYNEFIYSFSYIFIK